MGVTFTYGGKVMGSNFAEPPDGGVFGSEALRRVWYVTEAANLLRILYPDRLSGLRVRKVAQITWTASPRVMGCCW